MKNTNNRSFSSFLKSFGFAFHGLRLLMTERNFRFHLFAATLASILGFFLNISATEWLVVLLTIGLMLSLEGINTALEHLADSVTTDFHPAIKKAKDTAAGAVLISAIIALVIGSIIFVPKVIKLLP